MTIWGFLRFPGPLWTTRAKSQAPAGNGLVARFVGTGRWALGTVRCAARTAGAAFRHQAWKHCIRDAEFEAQMQSQAHTKCLVCA
jgi:hypothetical protein